MKRDRTPEFVLGLIGSFLGLFFALFTPPIPWSPSSDSDSPLILFLASFNGILGALKVREDARVGGILMGSAGIVQFIASASIILGLFPGLLLLIPALMALIRSD